MSFASLKALIFPRPAGADSQTRRSTSRSGDYGSILSARLRSEDSARTVTDADLEAQQQRPLLSEPGRPASPARSGGSGGSAGGGGFKIDARVISDATIGLSDGLTVPFALTAGLSALGDTKVVIFGSLAELIAGAISMGLGGYLGAKSELASYKETRSQAEKLVTADPQAVYDDILDVFAPYDIPAGVVDDLAKHLWASPRLVDFVTQFRHGAQEPSSSRPVTSAITIALGYFLGGLLPLVPYFCVGKDDLLLALYISVAVMAVALFSFGYVKTCVVEGWRGSGRVGQGIFGGVQMVVIGGAAAAAAMGLVKTFNQWVET